MGQRISYYRNNFKKGLKEIIFENFSEFRQWYLETDISSIEEFGEPFGNPRLKAYLRQDPDLKGDFHKLDKNLIDELTSEFIGSYCDTIDRENKMLELFGPAISSWRYEESSQIVLKTNDKELIRLWNFIIKGRSLSDYADFDSFTNELKIGFLSFGEHRILKTKIEAYFRNVEVIKRRRLAVDEQSEEIEIGLECVLQVLDEITLAENELITSIE